VAIFTLRDRLTIGPIRIILALAISFVMLNLPYARYLVALPVVYAAVGLGMIDVRRSRIIASANRRSPDNLDARRR
jgi:hypothetical protein